MSARESLTLADLAAIVAFVALDLLVWVVIIAAAVTIWRMT